MNNAQVNMNDLEKQYFDTISLRIYDIEQKLKFLSTEIPNKSNRDLTRSYELLLSANTELFKFLFGEGLLTQ